MKKGGKLFAVSAVLVIIILILIDSVTGIVCQYLIKKCDNTSFYGEINDAITEISPEILILGASTAKSDIIPTILSDSLKMSAYNAGSDGKNIMYHSCVGNAVINRNKPKIVLLVVHPSEFGMNMKDRVSVLNPFYEYDSLITATVNWKSRSEPIKMCSNLYRYNSTLFTLFKNAFGGKNTSKTMGFRALPVTGDHIDKLVLNNSETVDNTCIERFKWFVNNCENNNVFLSVLLSPMYATVEEKPQSISIIEDICNDARIPFLNYLSDSTFVNNPSLFKDAAHLNVNGAAIYTNMIIKDISPLFKTITE